MNLEAALQNEFRRGRDVLLGGESLEGARSFVEGKR
jgi:hypothetical protein